MKTITNSFYGAFTEDKNMSIYGSNEAFKKNAYCFNDCKTFINGNYYQLSYRFLYLHYIELNSLDNKEVYILTIDELKDYFLLDDLYIEKRISEILD